MPRNGEQLKSDLVGRIAAEARKRLGADKSAAVEAFIAQYYANVSPRDLRDANAEDLFGAVLAHWKLAAKRAPRTALVRVYNPTIEEHGWRCDHTVVEIVNDDMPFLVDSVTAELNRQGLTVHLIVHPIVAVRRDDAGKLIEIVQPGKTDKGVAAESFMHVQVNEQPNDKLAAGAADLTRVLGEVRAAVEDWRTMREHMAAVIADLSGAKTKDEAQAEVAAFLSWIHDNQFTFLGYREYELKGTGDKTSFAVKPDSGLGILRDPDTVVFEEYRRMAELPPDVRAFMNRPDLLMVTKTNRRSTVHRAVQMDSIGIKILDAKGKVAGEKVFVGLFTSSAYNRSPRDIPLLRYKIQKAVERAGFPASSHDAKALVNILETYPRDELFQVSDDQLFETSIGILHLQDRQRVALFVRRDDFERFVSCIIFIPRDRYTTALRQRIQKILETAVGGEMTGFQTQVGDSPLWRLTMTIATTPGKIPALDIEAIERELAAAARSWSDHLQDVLIAQRGEGEGLRLFHRYGEAFPPAYCESVVAATAVGDIDKIELALKTGEIGMVLYRPIESADNEVRFKIFHPENAIPLSDILPMLEHMGLKVMDEVPHLVRPQGVDKLVMIHDFGLETRDASAVELSTVRTHFQDAFSRIWAGEVESDGFNSLVLRAGLAWRQVVVLRAYCKFLRQAGIAFSQAYMEETLANYPRMARHVVELFLTLFDPEQMDSEKRADSIRAKIDEGLNAVSSADDDRILRRFVNCVESTLRTNYFQKGEDGQPKSYVSMKFDSSKLEDLPLPRPLREIFVYSARMEGVHLRFGFVARGGLRWSDRREDFRTEILGLVKAQQVKNAVIVPVGSKGGFVVKRPPASGDREAFMQEGIACYKTLIRGLLDITDNLNGNDVIRPKDVVRRDSDDPYLVVAADKGTATFSDIANGVSADYGFWLGDAFASGGSVGYDHKKMGITARGAWESVKRHFREIGVDTQAQDFTVVGVGDMSGDVFGNGMLLSPHIKLVGAFNHMHIFVDPTPDPAKTLAERKRLFDLPRSTWMDYDQKLISKGGGIFERKAKTIPASPEMKKLFGLAKDQVTPNELLTAMLKADVDLLWFGGIGTYVKATTESHADAGDRANDAIRVNGTDLRAKAVGEGANLGMTQRGRIQYGLAGGKLNTDSIDNSAGVDCSDHEVNIKILVDSVVAAGDLTAKQRNDLLAGMTEEVGELVLRDNYLQTQAISLVVSRGVAALDSQGRLMRMLERAGRLNRAVEYLPDEEALAERAAAKKGLTRPENAILMSYSKIWLYEEILQSDLPDDSFMETDLMRYFPTALQDKYADAARKHRLRREIIATSITNSLVNRVGGTFVPEFMEKTGMKAADISRAYAISREVFQLRPLWEGIEALDNKVPASAQLDMLKDINHLLEWTTLWFLRNGHRPLDVGTHVDEFADGVAKLALAAEKTLPTHYLSDLKERARPYVEAGVPQDFAWRIAGLVNLFAACDIVRLANKRKLPVDKVAAVYFAVGTRFRLGRLRAASENLTAETHWQKLAIGALVEETYGHQLALTGHVLDTAPAGAAPDAAIATWIEKNRAAVEQAEQMLTELWTIQINDLSMVAVASRQLRALADAAAA